MSDLGRPGRRSSWLPQAILIRFKVLLLDWHLVGNNQKTPKAPVEILEAQPYPTFAKGHSLRNRTTRKSIRYHHGTFLCWEVSEAFRLKCMLALFPDILPLPPVGVSYLPSMHTESGCSHAVFRKATSMLLPPNWSYCRG